MKRLHHSLLPVLLACAAAAAAGLDGVAEDRVGVSEAAQGALPGKTFDAATIIDAPAQKLCAILVDYAAYPDFMPNTKTVDVLAGGADHALLDMTLALPLGKTKKYRLRLDAQSEAQRCHVAWQLVPRADLAADDTIADTSGYWCLSALPANKNKSLVEYHVYADPGPIPYGLGWIVDILSKQSLPKTLEALRAQARKPLR
ncbi:SRPBCC family protein [Janthinobacterium sp.]|uniref:SRPBCC family protein n=1 Tax=Janthinobacterium sp. TaxID=1871054 RepID=UPI00293D57E8|nr:SRPBCC family protein [Janthinobacterium sp.]